MITSKRTHDLESNEAPSRYHRGRLTSFFLRAPKFHLVVILVLLATTVGFATWRSISIYRLEREIAANKLQTREAMVAQSGELLQLPRCRSHGRYAARS